MPSRQWLVLGGLGLLATIASCGSMAPSNNQSVNCNVVKLDRQAGQPVSDIADSFHVTEAEIEKCGTGPVEVIGGEQSEGATEAGASADKSAGAAGGGASAGGESGSSTPSGDTGGAPAGKPAM